MNTLDQFTADDVNKLLTSDDLKGDALASFRDETSKTASPSTYLVGLLGFLRQREFIRDKGYEQFGIQTPQAALTVKTVLERSGALP